MHRNRHFASLKYGKLLKPMMRAPQDGISLGVTKRRNEKLRIYRVMGELRMADGSITLISRCVVVDQLHANVYLESGVRNWLM
jgi:hypothetical protein